MRAGCSGSAGPACPCRTIPSRRRFAVRANSSAQRVCVCARACVRARAPFLCSASPRCHRRAVYASRCVICKRTGASVGCAKAQCKRCYHLPCWLEEWEKVRPPTAAAGLIRRARDRAARRRHCATLCEEGRLKGGIDRQRSAGARCCVGVVVLTHMWSARRLHSRSGPGPPRAPGAARGGHEQEQVSQHSMPAGVRQAA
jgi:hypothetical protein